MRINVLVLALIFAGCLFLGAACGAGVALYLAGPDREELQVERDEADRMRQEVERELQETELCWQKAEAALRREQAALDLLERLVKHNTHPAEAGHQVRAFFQQREHAKAMRQFQQLIKDLKLQLPADEERMLQLMPQLER